MDIKDAIYDNSTIQDALVEIKDILEKNHQHNEDNKEEWEPGLIDKINTLNRRAIELVNEAYEVIQKIEDTIYG